MKLKIQLTSILFYLGFSPFFPFLFFKKNHNNHLKSEYRTALSTLFLLNLSIILNIIIIIIILPAIAAISEDSELALIVNRSGCGWVIEPENPQALKNTILEAYQEKTLSRQLGNNGREYVEECLSKEVVIDSYDELITRLVNS